MRHTGSVVRHSLLLAKNRTVDREVLKTAAWLHDIGRTIDDDHHRRGAELARKFLVETRASPPFTERVVHCVLNHGSNGKPKTIEAKILRDADALGTLESGVFMFYFAKLTKLLGYDEGYRESKELLSKHYRKLTDPKAKAIGRKYFNLLKNIF